MSTFSTLAIDVVELFPDDDKIVMHYQMPIIMDPVTRNSASEIVAYHLGAMALELKSLDSVLHTVQ